MTRGVVDKVKKPHILEFWLTMNQWVQFTRVMERCHRAAGGTGGTGGVPGDHLPVTTWNGQGFVGAGLKSCHDMPG
jgi:hypothetical protein